MTAQTADLVMEAAKRTPQRALRAAFALSLDIVNNALTAPAPPPPRHPAPPPGETPQQRYARELEERERDAAHQDRVAAVEEMRRAVALEVFKRLSPTGRHAVRVGAEWIKDRLDLSTLAGCVDASAAVTEAAATGELSLGEAQALQELIERSMKHRWALQLEDAERLSALLEADARERGIAPSGGARLAWGRHADVEDAATVDPLPSPPDRPVSDGMAGW